jgi:AbrB family looped-hinge helix DNA binding protein
MQIEERTVSRVGGNSLMVTLPKGWLRYMGIEAGDKVEVITNGEIIIRQKRRRSSSARQADSHSSRLRCKRGVPEWQRR